MKKSKFEMMDWAFLFYWIMATTLGWVVGSIFFSGIPIVISGVAIAALQWAVLYKRIRKAWQWITISSLGWIVGYIIFIVFIPGEMGFLFGPLLGVVVGIAQWYILRQELDWSGWWIIISVMAWTTGLTLMPGLLSSGALSGAISGLTLVILFRFSSPRIQK